jgi:hypothetical protein
MNGVRRRSTRRRMSATRAGGRTNVVTLGGVVLGAVLGEFGKAALSKVIKDPLMRDGALLLVGTAGAYYTKPGLLNGVAMGIGASGGVGLAAMVMEKMGMDAPAMNAAGSLTPARRKELVDRIKAAGGKYGKGMKGELPQTLNSGLPQVLNASTFEGYSMFQ